MPLLLFFFLAPLLTVAWIGYGLLWLARLRPPRPDDRLALPLCAALGMGTHAYLILGVGLAGWLSAWSLWATLLGGLAAAAILGPRRLRVLTAGPKASSPPCAASRLLLGCLGLMMLVTLVGVFRPPDGLDWDGLSYHLAAPKIYLQEGRIGLIAYDSHTNFPFTLQMLYTLGLGLQGTALAKFAHWSAGWWTAAALGIWAGNRLIGGERAPGWVGPLAAALFAGMPIALWQLTTAYVDLGTAFFQLLALLVLLGSSERDEPRLPRAILAGVLTGFALGTKYTALLQFGLLGLGLLGTACFTARHRRGEALVAVLAFGAASVIMASPWYIKNWLWVHNPVYPFFYSVFPNSFSWTPAAAAAYAGEQASFGMGSGPTAAGRLLWNLGLHARHFYINQRSLAGDFLGTPGPWVLGALPLLFWAKGLDLRVRLLGLYALASVVLWFPLSQQVRYLLPVLAPVAVVIAVGSALIPLRPVRWALGVFFALSLGLSAWMHVPILQTGVSYLVGGMERDAYLTGSLPGLYESCRFVNALPGRVRLGMYQESRGFYLDRPYFWANPLQHNLIDYDSAVDGRDLVAAWRRLGLTHILVNYDFYRGAESSPWAILLQDTQRRGALVPIFGSRNARIGHRGVIVFAIR